MKGVDRVTKDEQIIMLETMTEETCYGTLSAYLSMAGDALAAMIYPFKDDAEVPRKYHSLQVEVAAYWLNKRGAEGEIQHSENGITRIYGSADIPDDMLSRVVPYVGVIGE